MEKPIRRGVAGQHAKTHYRFKRVQVKSAIITCDDPRWVAALGAARHDFYHLPCYQRIAAQPGEVPLGFLCEDAGNVMLLPFLKRALPDALGGAVAGYDSISPYGYPGPISNQGAPAAWLNECYRTFADELAAQDIVAAFIRLHTLLNEPSQFEGVGSLVDHGPSVYIDLTLSEEELWAQTRRGHKRDLAVLERRGYSITMDDWCHLDEFLKCYYDSMRRLGASDFYFFPRKYFEDLRDCLGDRIHLCLVRMGDEIACAGLVTEMDGLCQYHLSATADEYFQEHPSKLMLHHLRGWLKARGNKVYHVGGGVGALRDTLHLFKIGFSPLTSEFYTWRLIPDQARYDTLVNRWRTHNGQEPPSADEFFPQYRAPSPEEPVACES
jgi:hypothetical protein